MIEISFKNVHFEKICQTKAQSCLLYKSEKYMNEHVICGMADLASYADVLTLVRGMERLTSLKASAWEAMTDSDCYYFDHPRRPRKC